MHAWRHGPFHSLFHLIDIELMKQEVEAGDIIRLAELWGLGRVWSSAEVML